MIQIRKEYKTSDDQYKHTDVSYYTYTGITKHSWYQYNVHVS